MLTSFFKHLIQYKLFYTILNHIEVYEDPVPRTKKISHDAFKFEVGENRIVYKVCSDLDLSGVLLRKH